MEAKLSGAAFGEAGRRIVIEEGLEGEECSLLVLYDGTSAVPLLPAQDFKRVGDGDQGPNTGGMGAYAPMPHVSPGQVDAIMETAVEPLVAALHRRGIVYRGVLYAGLMLGPDGPRIIEYNVRFGDPEAQVVLPLLVVRRGRAVHGGGHRHASTALPAPTYSPDAAVCVVMASPGYPDHPRTGAAIGGLGDSGQSTAPVDGVTVFHAGTGRPDPSGPFYTSGGRVLGVTALAPTLAAARANAYAALAPISWEGMQVRHDIAAGVSEGARAVGARPRGAAGPMIPRYSPPDMAALFTDAARFALWLEVELLATEAQATLGVVPAEDAAACRAKAPVVDEVFVADVLERERVTDHDVAAFVDVVQDRIGAPAGSCIHYGLTSSDVVDTALSATLARAADLLVADLDAVRGRPARPRPGADGRPGHRAHPRDARRAHDLRDEVRPVGPAGRPRPPPHAPGPRRDRRGQALGRSGHVLQHRPGGRGPRVRRPRPHPGAGDPGDLP